MLPATSVPICWQQNMSSCSSSPLSNLGLSAPLSYFFFFSHWNHLAEIRSCQWGVVFLIMSVRLHRIARFRCEYSTEPSVSSSHARFSWSPGQTWNDLIAFCPLPKTHDTSAGVRADMQNIIHDLFYSDEQNVVCRTYRPSGVALWPLRFLAVYPSPP